MVQMNEEIFPEPKKFRPRRWLDNTELAKFLVPWSRGTRMCLGMKYINPFFYIGKKGSNALDSLAYAEIYLTIASIFRQFDLELFETTQERDVDVVHDYFLGMPSLASPGIRARVAGEIMV